MTHQRFSRSTTGRASRVSPAVMAGALSLAAFLAAAAPAHAQSGRGFLFSEPRWTLSIRGGLDRASAGSDIFEFMTDTLTLSKSDFGGFTFAGDFGYAISPRFDLAFGAAYVRSEKTS